MPVDLILVSAAFVTGLFGSVHCLAMCGGIGAGLTSTAVSRPGPAAALRAASTLNVARVAGYVIAGAGVGALGSVMQWALNAASWAFALRIGLGLVMVLIGLRIAGAGDRWNLLGRVGSGLWNALAPARQALLPAATVPRQILVGLLWGWLPCGLSSSVLLAAWLEGSVIHGALLMAAFGAGTLPAMIPVSASGVRWLGPERSRGAAAAFIICAGVLTATAPVLGQIPAVHAALSMLGCRSLT